MSCIHDIEPDEDCPYCYPYNPAPVRHFKNGIAEVDERRTITSLDDPWLDKGCPGLLRQVIEQAIKAGDSVEVATFQKLNREERPYGEWYHAAYFPGAHGNQGAVDTGGDCHWEDCDSLDDLMGILDNLESWKDWEDLANR